MVGACGRMCGSLFSVLIASLIAIGSIIPGVANAQDFDWRWLGSGSDSYVTPIRSQWGGTCWAFAAAGAAEAKYKITRNDPTYNLDLAEQHLVWDPAGGGSMAGGSQSTSLNFIRTNGIVTQGSGFGQIPDNSSTHVDDGFAPYWPIPDGAALLKITANQNNVYTRDASGSVDAVKANIKNYGPIAITIRADDDFYPPGSFRGYHAVVLTGWHDDASVPGGGYFWIKNSWGGSSYYKISYETVAGGKSTNLVTGLAYFTGPLATATWQGGAGTWSTTNSTSYKKWTKNSSTVAWINGEDAAVFDSPGGAITVGNNTGNISTHGITFETGATGYSFAADVNNDPLIVTGGGITANESVSFAVPMTVGAPQTWTVAAGKTLTINGTVNTHISSLTIGGDGNTVLNNTVWDVTTNPTFDGLLSGYSGSLTKNGSGILTLNAANTYTSLTHVDAGRLVVNGSLAGDVQVNVGAALGGSGSMGMLSGTGLVSPGQSAGILTAHRIGPNPYGAFSDMDYVFEFTKTGSPDYNQPSNSLNDVLRLNETGSSLSFSQALDSSSLVNVCFDVAALESGDLFRGAWYTDRAADFSDMILGGAYEYFVLGDGNGTHAVEDDFYYTLAEAYGAAANVSISTVDELGLQFGGIDGYVTQFFVMVPEPGTFVLLAAALIALGLSARFRRNRCPVG